MKIKSFAAYIYIHLDIANGNAAVEKDDLRPSKWFQIDDQRGFSYEVTV